MQGSMHMLTSMFILYYIEYYNVRKRMLSIFGLALSGRSVHTCVFSFARHIMKKETWPHMVNTRPMRDKVDTLHMRDNAHWLMPHMAENCHVLDKAWPYA